MIARCPRPQARRPLLWRRRAASSAGMAAACNTRNRGRGRRQHRAAVGSRGQPGARGLRHRGGAAAVCGGRQGVGAAPRAVRGPQVRCSAAAHPDGRARGGEGAQSDQPRAPTTARAPATATTHPCVGRPQAGLLRGPSCRGWDRELQVIACQACFGGGGGGGGVGPGRAPGARATIATVKWTSRPAPPCGQLHPRSFSSAITTPLAVVLLAAHPPGGPQPWPALASLGRVCARWFAVRAGFSPLPRQNVRNTRYLGYTRMITLKRGCAREIICGPVSLAALTAL